MIEDWLLMHGCFCRRRLSYSSPCWTRVPSAAAGMSHAGGGGPGASDGRLLAAGESAGLRVPALDRASAFFACHGALHCNDISWTPGQVLADGDDVIVPMGRWVFPEAQDVAKRVSVRRKGVKPHASSLASLDEPPLDTAGGHVCCQSSALVLVLTPEPTAQSGTVLAVLAPGLSGNYVCAARVQRRWGMRGGSFGEDPEGSAAEA